VADWAEDFGKLRAMHGGGTGPLPARLVEEAETLFADLLASQAEPVLLHGDLHHSNILSSAGRALWLAIDPKGVVGEPAYETGALLRNPERLLTEPEPGRILARRVDQLAEELGLDRARVRGWGLAQAVLAAVWGLEDHGEVQGRWLRCAELLAAVRA
jgi:streptomycin 6-kinase